MSKIDDDIEFWSLIYHQSIKAASEVRFKGEELLMKRFSGDRTIDGVKAWVDGRLLDPRLDLHRYTANGFEWSYEGDEPRQLALAILAEHLNDPADAKVPCRTLHEGSCRQFRQ